MHWTTVQSLKIILSLANSKSTFLLQTNLLAHVKTTNIEFVFTYDVHKKNKSKYDCNTINIISSTFIK